ncbi:hypothetical protein [Pedobacter sp.]|uniref:hypothetical protein n=1 Tax=Pedobacter sp. TaxID=1411316 RepID=UPI00396CA989
MKRIFLLLFVSVSLFTDASAQNDNTPERLGYLAGYDLGNYVKNTFVIPNVPPRATFRMIRFSSNPEPVLQTDGTYKQIRKFMIADPGDVTTIIYNQVVAAYAYESGLYDYYYNALMDGYFNAINGDEQIYYLSAITAFTQTIQGINPVNDPPGGPGVMPN